MFGYLQTTESLVAQCTVGDEGILRWWSNVGKSMWVASVHENCRSESVTPSSCTIMLILLCQVKWLEELTGAAVTSSSSSNTRLLEALASMPSDQAGNRTADNGYILKALGEQARARKQVDRQRRAQLRSPFQWICGSVERAPAIQSASNRI